MSLTWTCSRAVAVVAALLLTGLAAAAEDSEGLSAAEQLALIDAVRPALVRVEYTLQFDKGDAPALSSWPGGYAALGHFDGVGGGGDYVKEERPKEVGGFLIAPRLVLTLDLQLHPRFIRGIAVRAGDQVVPATPHAYLRNERGWLLELAEPLTAARPLEFQSQAEPPYYAIYYCQDDATWTAHVLPLPSQVAEKETGARVQFVPGASVIVDRKGVPVGASMNGQLPVDDSWMGPPSKWPAYSAAEMTALLAKLDEVASQSLLSVTLKFRSPKKEQDQWRGRYREDGASETEAHVVGVLIDPRTLLVLASLKPDVTARLEHIQVRLPEPGATVEAEFGCSLRYFGCFIATLSEPLLAPARLYDADLRALENELLLSAEVLLFGEDRTVRTLRNRLGGFRLGRHRRVYPELGGDTSHLFLFRTDGTLIAAPVLVRQETEEKYSWRSDEPAATPVAYIAALLADVARNGDPSNVPLTEEQENRLAWLGVELQDLDRELARANKISELTQDGSIGALVSYIYPDSPAAQAGLTIGDILLRIHSDDRPKPIPVQVGDDAFRYASFPWDRLDEVPEEYFDEIPKPWPSADNTLNRALTELGFGRPFKLELARDGQVTMKDFQVVESPPHFDSARRFKSEPLGLTVRNLTYEVRRYFQKPADDPGVIVAKIERGSKAAVAGLRPFEIVTHVNGEPVQNVGDFEQRAATAGTELRLTVKRMTRGRIVKIDMTAPAAEPASQPAEQSGARDE